MEATEKQVQLIARLVEEREISPVGSDSGGAGMSALEWLDAVRARLTAATPGPWEAARPDFRFPAHVTGLDTSC